MLSMMGNFTRPGWARARLLGQLVAQTARLRSPKTHSLDARPSRYGDAMQTIEGRRGGPRNMAPAKCELLHTGAMQNYGSINFRSTRDIEEANGKAHSNRHRRRVCYQPDLVDSSDVRFGPRHRQRRTPVSHPPAHGKSQTIPLNGL